MKESDLDRVLELRSRRDRIRERRDHLMPMSEALSISKVVISRDGRRSETVIVDFHGVIAIGRDTLGHIVALLRTDLAVQIDEIEEELADLGVELAPPPQAKAAKP